MIAAFTFSPRIYDPMRFVTALNSTIQAYLVKRNRYSEYTHVFQEITQHIANARILLDSPTDHGRRQSSSTRSKLPSRSSPSGKDSPRQEPPCMTGRCP